MDVFHEPHQLCSLVVHDMCSISETNTDVFDQFASGLFVANKTKQPFSGIALDHTHEQHEHPL